MRTRSGPVARRDAEDLAEANPTRRTARLVTGTAITLLVIAIVTSVLVMISRGGARPHPGPGAATFFAQGVPEDRAAPGFLLPILAGDGRIGPSTFAGKVVVLNIWASWCGPCRLEGPALEGLWRRYRDRGVQFLGIDHLDRHASGLAFERQLGVNYPSVYDPGGTVASKYGAIGIPTTYVITPAQRIVYRFLGRVRGPDVARVLDRLLSRPPGT